MQIATLANTGSNTPSSEGSTSNKLVSRMTSAVRTVKEEKSGYNNMHYVNYSVAVKLPFFKENSLCLILCCSIVFHKAEPVMLSYGALKSTSTLFAVVTKADRQSPIIDPGDMLYFYLGDITFLRYGLHVCSSISTHFLTYTQLILFVFACSQYHANTFSFLYLQLYSF